MRRRTVLQNSNRSGFLSIQYLYIFEPTNVRRGTHPNSFSRVGNLAVQRQLYPGPPRTPSTAEEAAFTQRCPYRARYPITLERNGVASSVTAVCMAVPVPLSPLPPQAGAFRGNPNPNPVSTCSGSSMSRSSPEKAAMRSRTW